MGGQWQLYQDRLPGSKSKIPPSVSLVKQESTYPENSGNRVHLSHPTGMPKISALENDLIVF